MTHIKYILTILNIIVIIVLLRAVAEPFYISGNCMEPGFKDGELYFLNHLAPYVRSYKIGDVVLYKYEEKIWISRIVALGTDTIMITDGKIIVNSKHPNDITVTRNWNNWKYGKYALNESLKVEENHVYMLSDNLSAHHDDSRVFGTVSVNTIIGLIWRPQF